MYANAVCEIDRMAGKFRMKNGDIRWTVEDRRYALNVTEMMTMLLRELSTRFPDVEWPKNDPEGKKRL
jgi:hypothetical protein